MVTHVTFCDHCIALKMVILYIHHSMYLTTKNDTIQWNVKGICKNDLIRFIRVGKKCKRRYEDASLNKTNTAATNWRFLTGMSWLGLRRGRSGHGTQETRRAERLVEEVAGFYIWTRWKYYKVTVINVVKLKI